MFNAREIAKQMYYRNIFDEEAIGRVQIALNEAFLEGASSNNARIKKLENILNSNPLEIHKAITIDLPVNILPEEIKLQFDSDAIAGIEAVLYELRLRAKEAAE